MTEMEHTVLVSLWKQRLFEIGVFVAVVIVALEIVWGGVPYLLELVFIGTAVVSILFQFRKSHCFIRASLQEIEISSPKMFGSRYRISVPSIEKIEEIDGIRTEIVITMKDGNREIIVLDKELGFCYSRDIVKKVRELFRKLDLQFQVNAN